MPFFAKFACDISAIDVARLLQNLFCDRAGVFGIDVDLPAAQCFPENDRSAHALAMFRREIPARSSDCFAISARTYDSVNFFEPMTTGSA